MTSSRMLHANRANCQRSTGPKTSAGRAKAAQNARRHGLRVPVMSDPALAAGVEVMARAIVGTDATPELFGLAARIAEAHLDVIRVRRIRSEIVSQVLKAHPNWALDLPNKDEPLPLPFAPDLDERAG